MRIHWMGLLAALLMTAAAAPAFADDASNKAAAEGLFQEARRLMAEQDYAAACPKLEASQRLDPGVGTMLNLADCYQKSGRTASAWAQFQETISAARKAGSLDREEIARARARELEPKLSYLTIVTWRGQEVAVTRDGAPVDPATFGTAIPIDPGEHVIGAAADGKRSWSTTVAVANGARVSVSVPILPDDSGNEAPVAAGGAGSTTPQTDGAPAEAGNDGSTQRIFAGVAAGVGVVGVVVGSVFGLKAGADWDDAKRNCDPGLVNCNSTGVQKQDDAESAATISTVAFIVGGVGLAAGVVLWLTAPDGGAEEGAHAALGITPSGVVLGGRF